MDEWPAPTIRQHETYLRLTDWRRRFGPGDPRLPGTSAGDPAFVLAIKTARAQWVADGQPTKEEAQP